VTNAVNTVRQIPNQPPLKGTGRSCDIVEVSTGTKSVVVRRRMKKIQRKKNEMRAAKEMKIEENLSAANILTNDYDEDMLF